jgi:aquaporin Z
MQGESLQRAAAEFVGAFTLIFVGVGAIAATAGGDLVAIAFAHGLAIGVMVSAVGHISGGHFNPAVTLGFWVTGRLSTASALLYWISQLAGAVVAALAISWLLPNAVTDPVALGIPALGDGVGATQGAVIEGILTFFLVWVVFATAADPGGTFASIAGLAIGFTITLDILMGGAFTGAAMNPARAFGPELVEGNWTNAWVWYVGPLIGGAVAAISYQWLYLGRAQAAPAKS